MRLYAIYDNGLQLSNPPFTADTDDSAVRLVRNMLLSADNTIFSKLRSVCDVLCLGEFDQKTAVIEALDTPRLVAHFTDIPLPDFDNGGA